MNKDDFWQIIEQSKEEAEDDLRKSCAFISKRLAELEVNDILKFHTIFETYYKLSYKSKLWAAAYVINGGCSDDGFDYFRAGLIAQGKELFLEALKDPDSLVDTDVEGECESMLGVCYQPYFDKKGLVEKDYKVFYQAVNEVKLNDIDYCADIDINWDEDNLQPIVPRLCEKFGC